MKSNTQGRIKLIGVVFFLFSLLLIFRLYFIQIVHGDFFTQKADRQYSLRDGTIFNRGDIYFRDKDGRPVSAATLKDGFTLAINPRLIENSGAVLEKIKNVFPEINSEDFMVKAAKTNDPYEEVVTHLSGEIGTKIDQLNIPGVIVEKERWRYYPGDNLASQTLGFVAYDNENNIVGRYGLERYYEDILKRDENKAYANFFAQIFGDVGDAVKKKEIKGEGDLILTIEPEVEQEFTNQLKKVKEEYSGEEVGGVIMNPNTGEIYALSALPDFNPNKFNEEKNQAAFVNPIVESVYEMGSIIKPLTMAAGIDAGAVTPTTTYDDKGKMTLDGKTFYNYDGKGRGVVPMQEVLSQSLNTGVAFVVSKMGNDVFANYFKNYGLGEETGIDLPGEIPGLTKNLDSTRDIEYATASFGQGIAMTPIATVRALATLANGGELVNPHVVKEIKYKSGLKWTAPIEPERQVLKKETSEKITQMLIQVVDTALLHGKIKMEHYSIAAKTGTAQVANPAGGGYYEDRYLHSFFGYFPAYKPQFIVFMYMYYPKNVQFASETLTVPFSNVAKFLINHYEIPPDR